MSQVQQDIVKSQNTPIHMEVVSSFDVLTTALCNCR